MKNQIFLYAAGLAMMAGLSSCADDFEVLGGEGTLKVKATVNSDVNIVSRAANDSELAENMILWISSEKGVVRKFQGLQNVPADGIPLTVGSYVLEGWAGDSIPASWDAQYFTGSEPFQITNNATTQVDLTCKIRNVVVTVDYSAEAAEVLTDYNMEVKHSQGSLTFEGNDSRRGFFMMNSRDKDLEWTLTGTTNTGESFTRTGKILNVKPAYQYNLKVKYTGENVEVGGAYFTIEVDESAIEIESSIEIVLAPYIQGYYFDMSQPIYAEAGAVGRKSVYISSAKHLESVVLTCDAFESIFGFDGNDFDIINSSASVISHVNAGGINATNTYDPAKDESYMKINFEEAFMNNLTNGDYVIDIAARDSNGKTSHAQLTISISDAAAIAEAMSAEDMLNVYTDRATINGIILKDGVDASSLGFNYREKGASSWNYVPAQLVSRAIGDKFQAQITDLRAGTTYEYVAVSGGVASTAICEFTTEAAAQLPNASFEDWQTSSSPYLIFAAGGQKFWDSGNHGSATMRKNVTEPTTSPVHSGNYAASLNSQFVGVGSIGKFAAGNIFIGEYLKTDGTDGVLGWGRAFTSRPKALKGYVKYTPGSVQYTDAGAPDIVKNQPDKGIIYVALLDDHTENFEGKDYPVIIKTKASERQLFDKNSEHVIAYGELVFEEATSGDGLVEFTINLNYVRNDVKPSYILLTCAASKGGDYFAGGNSKMIIDDFQLVY